MSVYMNKYVLSFGTGNSSPRSALHRGRSSSNAHIGAPFQDGLSALVRAGGRVLQRVRRLLARTTLSSFIMLRGAVKPISVEPAGSAVAFALSAEIDQPSLAAGLHAALAANLARASARSRPDTSGYGYFDAAVFPAPNRAKGVADRDDRALSGQVPPGSPAAAVQSFIGKSWTMEGGWEPVNSSIVHNGRLSAPSGRKTFYPPTPYVDLATHKLAAAAYRTAQSHIAG